MDYNDSELGDTRPPIRRYPLRVILTRAVEQQHAWREAVERAGFECESLPLFRVQALSDEKLLTALGNIDDVKLIVVISPNAAQGLGQMLNYTMQQHAALHHQLRNMRFAVPGPGTRDVLIKLGIDKAQIICPLRRDFAYDAQALLQAVNAAVQFGQLKAGPAIILHGEQTSPELAVGLAQIGLPCRGVAVYAHGPAQIEPSQTLRLATLLTSAHEVVWVLTQSRAVAHLDSLARGLRPAGLKGHRVITIHPRIAQSATQAGFADVRLIEPSPVSLVAELMSMAGSDSSKSAARARQE